MPHHVERYGYRRVNRTLDLDFTEIQAANETDFPPPAVQSDPPAFGWGELVILFERIAQFIARLVHAFNESQFGQTLGRLTVVHQ